MLQFSIRGILAIITSIAVLLFLLTAFGEHESADFLPPGLFGYFALPCFVVCLIYVASRKDATIAWSWFILAWLFYLTGQCYAQIDFFRDMSSSVYDHGFYDLEYGRRYPWWILAKLTIPLILSLPLLALLLKRKQKPLPTGIKYFLFALVVALFDIVVLWLSRGAICMVSIGEDSHLDWSLLFK